MKISIVLPCMLWLPSICALGTASNMTSHDITKQTARYGHLKIMMEDLQNQQWNNDEKPCLDGLIRIMRNVQNSTLWATWIWDSMQSPVGHLYGSKNNFGNYDECVEFPWEKVDSDMRTQYCLAHIHLSEVDFRVEDVDFFGNVQNYIRAKSKHHLKFNTLNWGLCTPATCKRHSIVKFVSVLYSQTYLGLAVNNPTISIAYCDIAGNKEVFYGMGYYFTLLLIIFGVMFAILATLMISSGLKKSFFMKAFYIPTNIQSLMMVTNNDVNSLFGIRVICCCLVVGIHVFWFMKHGAISNAVRLDKDFNPILTAISTLEMSVDTFLLMSGLLLVRGLMTDGLNKLNPLKVIVKRYLRIIWPISILLLVTLNLLDDFSNGPAMKAVVGQEIEACRRNWLKSLLMIQNYVDTMNMCYPVLWSLTVDFHLSVLATIICWIFLKSRKTGSLVFLIGFIISIATPATFVYSNYQRYCPLAVDFRLTDNYRKNILQNEVYISTHFRSGSYFVGMAIGYILFKYNPAIYKNIISKKYSILGFSVFLIMVLGITVIVDWIEKHEYSPIEAALFLSLKRVLWAVSIGFLIMICEYGTLPLVNNFLGWSAWVPISRLTFGVYLLHPIFIYYSTGAIRNPQQFDFIGTVLNTLGVTVLSSIFSLFLWTFFEAPMQNFIRMFFRSQKKEVDPEISKECLREEINTFGDISNRKKTL